jgi:hypothetical protein
MNDKIIATNLTALRAKYGAAGLKKINAALKTLIAADKARGFQTRVIALDSATAMKRVKGSKVTDAADPAQNKAAIDAIHTALMPGYLVLLGAPDVIPHQDLRNPVFSDDDPDEFAFGDIPYACSAPYSQEAKDFIGPTRVVGRLPDLAGGSDPAYLLGLLAVAASWKSRPAADYASCFAISAAVWKGSTALSLQKLSGSSADLQLSPPKGPAWTAAQLGRRAHFINCHGASIDPTFYGQKASSYPVAHLAANVAGRITEGTVAAVECCYGGELYDAAGGPIGICSTYLAEKAYGYFGSSTIAYGPADSNGAADLLCQYFLRRVRAGASLGRAALEARLEFAGGAPELDPIDLKTIAQFNLLGDPSIHPVASATPHTAVAVPKGIATRGARAAVADAAFGREDRRRQLLSRGLRIAATQACAARIAHPKLPTALRSTLTKLAKSMKLTAPTILSFKITAPATRGPIAAAMRGGIAAKMVKLAAPDAFHVLTGAHRQRAISTPQIVAVVAKEVGGKIVSYREMRSR